MRTLTALTLVAASVQLGCGETGANDQLPCGRGFRAADWIHHRILAGTAIAKCDWLDGDDVRDVQRKLGPRYGGSVRHGFRYNLGADAKEGSSLVILTVRFDSRRLVRAAQVTREPF